VQEGTKKRGGYLSPNSIDIAGLIRAVRMEGSAT
jgi:hypothetical protein